MTAALRWTQDGTTLHLAGELDSGTVLPLWQQRENVATGITTFELTGLTRIDTAGLALLIHLISIARQQGGESQLQGAGENLRTLAHLYNLPETLLPHLAG